MRFSEPTFTSIHLAGAFVQRDLRRHDGKQNQKANNQDKYRQKQYPYLVPKLKLHFVDLNGSRFQNLAYRQNLNEILSVKLILLYISIEFVLASRKGFSHVK